MLGGSNEYPQSVCWIKNKKVGIPLHIPALLYLSVVKGVITARTCFPDAMAFEMGIQAVQQISLRKLKNTNLRWLHNIRAGIRKLVT